MSRRDLDEDDVRVRPNRRGSRPRSKDRPRHESAVVAVVTAVDRGRYTTLIEPDGGESTLVMAMKARELARKGVVVGDHVALVGDTSGDPNALARIVRIEPRPRLIDRCLVAAYDAGMDPVLVLTKSDLTDPADFLSQYAPLDVPCVVTSSHGADGDFAGLGELRDRLTDRTSVLVGHSGVGKSTLVNALVPEADRATGAAYVHLGGGTGAARRGVGGRHPRNPVVRAGSR